MLRWVTEVRVHGVSGTPASSMLRTDPERVDGTADDPAGDGDGRADPIRLDRAEGIQVLAAQDDIDEISGVPLRRVAYNWSDLTSGRRRHAFWLLLLPYTLVNTAGWMLPPGRRGDARIGFLASAMVRVGGVVVTAVFTLFALAVSLQLFVYECIFGPLLRQDALTCRGSLWAIERFDLDTLVSLGSLFPAAAVTLMGFVIGFEPRRRTRAAAAFGAGDAEDGGAGAEDATDAADPARTRTITDRTLWRSHPIGWQLAVLHAATAFATVGIVAYSAVHPSDAGVVGDPYFWLSTVLVPLGILGATVSASASVHRSGRFATAVLAVAGLTLGTVVALVMRVQGYNAAIVATEADWFRTLTLTLVGVTVALSVVLVLLGRPDFSQAIPPAALLFLAVVVGAVFGSGAYLLALSLLGRGAAPPPAWFPGMDWIALSFLLFLLVAIGGLALWVSWTWDQGPEDTPMAGLMRGLRRITSRPIGLLAGMLLLPLVMLFIFTILGNGGEDGALIPPFTPDGDLVAELELVTAIAVALALAGVVSTVWRYLVGAAIGPRATMKPVVALGGFGVLAAVLVAAVWALAAGRVGSVEAFGLTLDFSNVRQIAMSVAVLVPVAIIGGRVRASLSSRAARRGLAIAWDIGSFWPRWYHPLAAPSYTPIAVPDLQAFVDSLSREDTAIILAAHSQGSVLGMVSLLSGDLSEEQLRRVAFLTYGSPVAGLYERLFPAHFGADQVGRVCDMLTPEDTVLWLNLWRDTDPIGGPIGRADMDVDLGADPTGDGHSGYEGTLGYRTARGALAANILGLRQS